MVGEPGDKDPRDLPQRGVQLKRAGQPLADPFQDAEPVRLALRVPAARLGNEHHDALDLAGTGRRTQRYREFPDEQEAAVAAMARERVFPGNPVQYLPGDLVDPAGLAVRQQAETADRLANQ